MTLKMLSATAATLMFLTASTPASADQSFAPFALDIDVPKLLMATVGTTVVTGMGLGVSGLQLSMVGERLPQGAVGAGLVSAAANVALGTYLLLDDCSNDDCDLSRTVGVLNMSTAALNLLTSFMISGLEPAHGTAHLTPVLVHDGRATHLGLACVW